MTTNLQPNNRPLRDLFCYHFSKYTLVSMLIPIALLSLCSFCLVYVCFKIRSAPFQLQMSALDYAQAASITKIENLDSDESNNDASSKAVEDLALIENTQTALTVAESSQKPTTSTGCAYEVFLSFCGKDTRKSFVDCLYEDLTKAGIQTFRDDEDLGKGTKIEELLQAIENSKIAIPVLSRNYASRKWCLHELAKIMECNQQKNQKVLPIFYDVEPCVVRDQTDVYDLAFKEHQKKFDQQTVKNWRRALKGVASLSGWELQKTHDGHQGKLINTIISHVWKELGKFKLFVPKHIKRPCELEEKLMNLLDLDANDVRTVGICGEPDSGKTILAKCVYNDICNQFGKHCSFLANINEKVEKYGLESLQKQLIDELIKGNSPEKVFNIDCGIQIIKERFRNMKVLILLDDVGRKEHLDALAKEHEWFGLGSRIIVTTRYKDILNDHEVYRCLVMPNPQAQRSRTDLLQKRTVGSSVHEATADKVLTSLMQKYDDAITSLMEQCFLYCAVYPKNRQIKRRELIDLYIHAGLIKEDNREAELQKGNTVLNMLENDRLLERVNTPFQESNTDLWEVKMPDGSRDIALGSKKVEFMLKAGNRIVQMPDEKEWEIHREGKNLEVVSLMNNHIKEIVISPKCPMLLVLLLCFNPLTRISKCFFMQMPALRVLNLSFTNIKKLPKSVEKLVKLVELNLRCCRELEKIPSLAKLSELRKLDLFETAIKQEPHGLNKLVKLRYLGLSFQKKPLEYLSSGKLKEPLASVLSKLHHFEAHFAIAGPEKPKPVSSCFQQWYNFFMAVTSSSKASNCYVCVDDNVISGTPIYASICINDVHLKTIDINVSSRERSIVIPKDKKVLRMLVPNGKNLWDSHQQMLEDLRGFKVQECKELKEVIAAGQNKTAKAILIFPKLQELELEKLPRLENISEERRLICNSLKRVFISNCPVLLSLGLLPKLDNLEELTVRKCGQLTVLIIEEEAEESSRVDDRPINITLPHLNLLRLHELHNLKNISGKKGLICKALCNLEINNCPTLVSLKLLTSLEKLERLIVLDCGQLEDIFETSDSSSSAKNVVDVPNLKKLILGGLPKLRSGSLRWLNCNSLRKLEFLRIPLISLKLLPDALQNLQILKICDCEQMEEITATLIDEAEQDNNMVVYIGASHGKANNFLNATMSLPELEYLCLENLPYLKKISDMIFVCNSLRQLKIHKCPELKWIPITVLSGLQSLVELEVVDCELVEEIISALSDEAQGFLRNAGNGNEFTLTKLRSLRLGKLPNLTSILPKPLVCQSLEVIEIIECPQLKRIPLSQQAITNTPSPSSLKDVILGNVYIGIGFQLMNDDEVDQVFRQSKRWWESLEWDDPNAEKLLRHNVRIIGEESFDRKLKDEIKPIII